MDGFEDDVLSVESSPSEVNAFVAGYEARLVSVCPPEPMPGDLVRSFMLGWRAAGEVDKLTKAPRSAPFIR